jgi:hypothetical protein
MADNTMLPNSMAARYTNGQNQRQDYFQNFQDCHPLNNCNNRHQMDQ